MKFLQKVKATFKPKDLASLKAEGNNDIGKQGTFTASWVIEDGHQFAGQYAMAPNIKDGFSFAWCPEEDLEIIEDRNIQ